MTIAERLFTEQELRRYNGDDNETLLVAFEGVVYEVTASTRWRGGLHERQHFAGQDLTTEIAEAPHGPEVFQRAHIRRAGLLKSPS